MRKGLRWLSAGLAALLVAALVTSVVVSRPLHGERLVPGYLEEIVIAPRDQALTFARVRIEGGLRLLLVTDYRDGKVIGVDLNRRLGLAAADPLDAYRRAGYEALRRESASIADLVAVPADALEVPFDAHERNIAVGLNYREHADESALDEEPFLFPKFARPTRATGDVARKQSILLDYEAELGLVALEELSPASPPKFGLVLANELTDRWRLARGLDRSRPMGTTGFADAKSREGFAPIGPLLVIPRDLDFFYKRIELNLYLNDRLRQHEIAGTMSWSPERILKEVFRRAREAYAHAGSTTPLLQDAERVPAGTIIFSGTPAGVIFKPLNLWNPWVYLRPGDEVIIRADYLGVIRSRITE